MRETHANNKKTSKSKDDFTLHQRVLWNINSHYHGNKKKFGPKWVGPYEITDIFNRGANYEITLIPMKGNNINNPMNHIKIPKKGNPIINQNTKSIPKKINTKKSTKNGLKNIIIPPKFNVPRSQLKPYFDDWESVQKAIKDNTKSPADNKLIQLTIEDADKSPIDIIINSIKTINHNNKLMIHKLKISPQQTFNDTMNVSNIITHGPAFINNKSYSLFGIKEVPKIRNNSIIHGKYTKSHNMYNKSIKNTFNKSININNKLLTLNTQNQLRNEFTSLMNNNEFVQSYNNNMYIKTKQISLKNNIIMHKNIYKTPMNCDNTSSLSARIK